MPDADRRRLEAALCLATGGEAFTVLRDVCGLEPDQAIAVAHWAAQALLTAGLQKVSEPCTPPSADSSAGADEAAPQWAEQNIVTGSCHQTPHHSKYKAGRRPQDSGAASPNPAVDLPVDTSAGD